MSRVDKYGRGSAAANGEGFVDLAPGDTFAALEAQLKQRIAERFDNAVLGISASIGSKRNASELAKHLASGEMEEVHKFAAKNIGVLFAMGGVGIVHFDKKAVDETREKPKILRVFSPFVFAGEPLVATITIKPADDGLRLYAIEALDIMRGERLEVHLAAEPRQFKTSRLLLADRISYYVGDVNRTHPKFFGRDEMFSTEQTAELVAGLVQDFCAEHQAPSTKHQAPKLSIIIPVYNVAPYLRECLDSVLVQTITDWEAICIDDGSTDGSGVILDAYAARDNRFKVLHQENRGVSATRQRGLELARGEYIGWVDSDDVIDPSHFENLYHAAESSKADLSWCGYVEDRNGVRSVCPMICKESAQAMLEGILTCRIMGFLISKLFRRAKIVESGARFPQYCQIMEDSYFLAGFLSANPSVKYVAQTTYHYLVRGNSLSNEGCSSAWWEAVVRISEEIEQLLINEVPEQWLRYRAAHFRYVMFFDQNVTDKLFYAFHPDLRMLPSGMAPLPIRVIFGLSTFGFRRQFRALVKLLVEIKRRLHGSACSAACNSGVVGSETC